MEENRFIKQELIKFISNNKIFIINLNKLLGFLMELQLQEYLFKENNWN